MVLGKTVETVEEEAFVFQEELDTFALELFVFAQVEAVFAYLDYLFYLVDDWRLFLMLLLIPNRYRILFRNLNLIRVPRIFLHIGRTLELINLGHFHQVH